MFRFKKKLIAKFKSLLFLMIKEIQSMSKNLKSVITCDLDGKIETFSKVTFPLIYRGLLAGGALVFLSTMK